MAELNEILGNERITRAFYYLAVHHKKISHAYIIGGRIREVGKKMLAEAFSKILQCGRSEKLRVW